MNPLFKNLGKDLMTFGRQRLMDAASDVTEAGLDNVPQGTNVNYVRVIGSDGESYKIEKEAFMGLIRDALPAVLSNLNGNIAQVFGKAANGGMGFETLQSLASVLGVGKWIEVQGTKNTPVRLPNVGSGRVFLFSPTLTSANMLCIGTDSGADKQNNPWYSNNVSFGNDNGSCTVTWTQNWTSVFIYIIGY